MSGVVVGRRQHEPPDTALTFAAEEARLRGRELTLLHIWDLDVDVTVDAAIGELGVAATAHASPGPIGTALFADAPELVVLSRAASARHLSRLLHLLLRHATCPLAVVPSGPSTTITRVVVGVCGTNASVAALRWAAREAELHEAQLEVVHAWQLRPTSLHDAMTPGAARDRARSRIQATLEDWVAQVVGTIDATVTVTARPGGPLDCLLDATAGADLAVVGLTEHHGINRVWHGHLAEDLTLLAACPTVVVPTPVGTAPNPPGG